MYSRNVQSKIVHFQTAVQDVGEVKYALLPSFIYHATSSMCVCLLWLQLTQYEPNVSIILMFTPDNFSFV